VRILHTTAQNGIKTGELTGTASHVIIPRSHPKTGHITIQEIPLKKSKIVVLFLFIYASGAFAETPNSPVCIPLETDGRQIAILIQGAIPPDKIAALQKFIREQMSGSDSKEELIRVAILRDGVCIPSD